MTFAVQTLIEKSAYENGWENRVSPLVFASARHPGTLRVRECDKVLIIELDDVGGNSALSAAFPTYVRGGVLELPLTHFESLHNRRWHLIIQIVLPQ